MKIMQKHEIQGGAQTTIATMVLVFIISFLFAPAVVFAQAPQQTPTKYCRMTSGGENCSPAALGIGTCNAILSLYKATGAAEKFSSCYPKYDAKSVIATNAGNMVGNIVSGLLEPAAEAILEGISYLLFQAAHFFMLSMGYFLDFSLRRTIDSSLYEGLGVINDAWGVMRDIANMFFIFVLMYIAITTILGLSGHSTKTMLRNVILAALLINFSLFFTKVVIDVGNVLAVGLWNNMGIKNIKIPGGGTQTAVVGPSEAIAKSLDLQLVVGEPPSVAAEKKTQSPEWAAKSEPQTRTLVYLGGAILMFISGFVFLSGAIMMVIRTVKLFFLMILSPFGFIGLVVPKTAGYAHRWWDSLINEAMVAPAYMLMVYITVMTVSLGSLRVFSDGEVSNASFISLLSGDPGSISILFQFFIVCGLMLGSLKVAQSVAGETAGMASRMAKTASGMMSGAAVGTVAYVGRKSVGNAGAWLQEQKWLQEAAVKGGITGTLARTTGRVADTAARSSFDMRGSTVGRYIASGGGAINPGQAGGQGGYRGVTAKKDADVVARAERLFPNNPEAQQKYIQTHTTTVGSFVKGKVTDTGTSRYDQKPGKYASKEEKVLKEAKDKLDVDIAKKAKIDRIKTLTEEGKIIGKAEADELRKLFAEMGGKDSVEALNRKRLDNGDYAEILNRQMVNYMMQNSDKYQNSINENLEAIMERGMDDTRQYIIQQRKFNPSLQQLDLHDELKKLAGGYDTRLVDFDKQIEAAQTEREKADLRTARAEFKEEADRKTQDILGSMKPNEINKLERGTKGSMLLIQNYSEKQLDEIAKLHETIRDTEEDRAYLESIRRRAESGSSTSKKWANKRKNEANKGGGKSEPEDGDDAGDVDDDEDMPQTPI